MWWVQSCTVTFPAPSTLFNITVKEVGPFWITIKWTAINELKLHGPPTGYKIVYCNKTCGEKETKEPEAILDSLRPKTLYKIRMWAFNIDSFKQRLENLNFVTKYEGITAPDSQTSLIFVIAGSIGVLVFVAGFIIYVRRSNRVRRKAHRFNVVKSYDESYTLTSTRNSV